MQAIYVLPPVIVGYVLQFVYSIYVNAELYLKKQRRIAIGSVLIAGINILLNIALVPRFGYLAAAYTTLFSYVCLAFYHYLSIMQLGAADWFDNKKMWCLSIGGISFIPLFNAVYNDIWLRSAVILFFIILTFIVMLHYRSEVVVCSKKYFGRKTDK